jgi:esterase/lipase superfamily enzyme
VKSVERWHSDRVGQAVTLVRWGEIGAPVLVFPTAGGDAEEIERFGLVEAMSGLLATGRIKVYSVDSIAGRGWMGDVDAAHASWIQDRFEEAVGEEVVPAIRADCRDQGIEIIVVGASIGAFNAVAALCRHPGAFRIAIGMSGTYDLSPKLGGFWSEHFHRSSPMHHLPDLEEGPLLDRLRTRFVVLATGRGAWEDPGQSWAMAHALGSRGVPNRVDLWSEHHDHDWSPWREMLPVYLDDLA